ncbi:MAG: hypothetical protein U0R64_00080 [Candidatus Nanopelagicales bacterium]
MAETSAVLREPATRRAWPMVITALVLLAVGALLATQLGAALGLSNTPVEVPEEHLTAAAEQPIVPPPDYQRIVISDDPQIRLAARRLAEDLSAAGAKRPLVATEPSDEPGVGQIVVTLVKDLGNSDQAFRAQTRGDDVTITGASPTGAANGLYAAADRIRSGREMVPPADDGKVINPALQLRLVDTGAVGIDADAAGWKNDDYSLNTDVVGTALLPDAPYVDPAKVAEISRQYRQFIEHSLALGYNGVIVPGFLEYVTFAGVGDGTAVYAKDDPRRLRAKALVQAFGPVWQYAHEMGMQVFFGTDMLALSPPLRNYLTTTYGGLKTEDEQFWTVYQQALDELFTQLPYAAGLLVRIGEGGDVYHMEGWDFTSEIAVTTPAAVQQMLTSLLATAGKHGKDIIFRTWTVGVGAVGDLHTSSEAYQEVLGGINADNLIVSTKFTKGDFYSYLPFNDTLAQGDHKRIIEFQARREFEAFGSLPNDLTVQQQQALQQFLAANPNVIGVWNWTQSGGPLRAGPRTLYLREGFWQLFGLNTYAVARLAWNPELDAAQVTADWARQMFSDDPATVAAIGEVMALSRDAVTKGLYIGPYASQSVKALGLEPPPMMWIFEWDIPTGDSAVLDSIYAVSHDRIDEAVAEGRQAVELAEQQRDLIAATDPSTWRSPQLRNEFLATLDFQVSLYETLAAYREMVLRHAQWLDTGDPGAQEAWASARDAYLTARNAHEAAYADSTALPAWNFTAADIGLQRAERDPVMAWLARILFVGLLVILLLGTGRGQRVLRNGSLPGAAACRALWMGLTRPWRPADLEFSEPGPQSVESRRRAAPTALDRVLIWLIPAAALVVSRGIMTWFLAPAHLLVVLSAWLLFVLVLRGFVGRLDPFWLWAGIGGAVLLRVMLLLVALMARGPGRYWFNFWTAPNLRTVYITLAFAAFLWVFVVAAIVLRDRYGYRLRGGIGRVSMAMGVPLVVLGGLVQLMGLESALTTWNDQMALLPWGLSRILGITVYLGIPTELPLVAMAGGAMLIIVGALLSVRSRRVTPADGLSLTRG